MSLVLTARRDPVGWLVEQERLALTPGPLREGDVTAALLRGMSPDLRDLAIFTAGEVHRGQAIV